MSTGAGPSPARPPRGNLSFEGVVGALNAAVAVGLAFHLIRELFSTRELASTDFTVFRTGWSLIIQGRARELYDASAQAAAQTALLNQVGSQGFQEGMMAFLHPPHAALAGCLFGWIAQRFGLSLAFWIWTGGSVALLVYLVRLVRDELGGGARVTALVAVTLAAFYPVLETLQQGQVSALLAVAALAFAICIREGRAFSAALWLLALSIKPQTLPPLLVVLAVRREYRVLSVAGALGAGAFLLTAVVLGPGVWLHYATQLPGLERFFGVGTPDHMPTVRGLLTRLFGAGGHYRDAIDALALMTWVAAIGGTGFLASLSRRQTDGRAALAFAFAAGALASPHLFPQDVLVWVAPITLLLSLSREEGEDVWRRRVRVVLVWPLWFVMARALDIRDTPRTQMPIDLTIIPLVVATAWAARAACRQPRAAQPSRDVY
jgi:hypothetical protein